MRVCPTPTPCYQPVLPCCNPQCPPPIVPKQRPICPRAPHVPIPCVPINRSCCPYCETDPVTRSRPLIVHDSLFHARPTGLPADCYARRSPNVRYLLTEYYKQVIYIGIIIKLLNNSNICRFTSAGYTNSIPTSAM